MTVGSNPPKPPETSLPMVQQLAQPDRVDRQKQEALNDVIRKQVMHVLGDFVTNLRKSGAEPVERPRAADLRVAPQPIGG
jgi:hypothetical protein